MIISNVSTGFFSRNAYQGSWSNSFACAITNAVKVCGNYSTTVAGNNDGISCNNSNITGTVTFPGTAVFSGTAQFGALTTTLGGSATIFDHTSFAGAAAGTKIRDGLSVGGTFVVGMGFKPNDVQQATQIVAEVDYPLSFATNYVAAEWVPIPGRILLRGSNYVLYGISPLATNVITALQ